MADYPSINVTMASDGTYFVKSTFNWNDVVWDTEKKRYTHTKPKKITVKELLRKADD